MPESTLSTASLSRKRREEIKKKIIKPTHLDEEHYEYIADTDTLSR